MDDHRFRRDHLVTAQLRSELHHPGMTDHVRARTGDRDTPRAWDVAAGFDLGGFLAQPLVARLATAGPNVLPIWFLWEERAFWWLTGDWSRLLSTLRDDPAVALVVDTCDLSSGSVLQVIARGVAEPLAFDAERARRWGHRYLGSDERRWGRFADAVFHDPSTRFVRLVPTRLRARDLSFTPSTVADDHRTEPRDG